MEVKGKLLELKNVGLATFLSLFGCGGIAHIFYLGRVKRGLAIMGSGFYFIVVIIMTFRLSFILAEMEYIPPGVHFSTWRYELAELQGLLWVQLIVIVAGMIYFLLLSKAIASSAKRKKLTVTVLVYFLAGLVVTGLTLQGVLPEELRPKEVISRTNILFVLQSLALAGGILAVWLWQLFDARRLAQEWNNSVKEQGVEPW